MDENLELILTQFESMKGQFVITQSWRVERLVAIGGDDNDYYYVTYDGRKFIWNTCVGSLIQLKNKIDDKDYNELIRLAKINHYDQENLWMPRLPEQKEEILQLNKDHKFQMLQLNHPQHFLSQVCWDIN